MLERLKYVLMTSIIWLGIIIIMICDPTFSTCFIGGMMTSILIGGFIEVYDKAGNYESKIN